VEIVKNNVFHVLGPQGNHHKDFERFICAYKSGIFYYILDWLDFPFFHISSNPGVLSKIIAEKSYLYLINFPEKFDLEDFTHEDVCPPARLLAHYLKKVPYDQQLLLDSIKYYRDCPPKEKQGVFAILYKVLNKLE
jgi:hypothetical protein